MGRGPSKRRRDASRLTVHLNRQGLIEAPPGLSLLPARCIPVPDDDDHDDELLSDFPDPILPGPSSPIETKDDYCSSGTGTPDLPALEPAEVPVPDSASEVSRSDHCSVEESVPSHGPVDSSMSPDMFFFR